MAKNEKRKVCDDPRVIAERGKLQDLQAEFAMKDQEYRRQEDQQKNNGSISDLEKEAAALLGNTAVATLPSLTELRRDLHVRRLAIGMQEDVVRKVSTAAANDIVEDYKNDHRRALKDFIAKQSEAFASYDKLLAVVDQARAACGGNFLPEYNVLPIKKLQFQTAFNLLSEMSGNYIDGKTPN